MTTPATNAAGPVATRRTTAGLHHMAASGALLLGGAVAWAVFVVASALQAALRPGFDLTRHPVSMLSNGHLGWIQIADFLLVGALTVGSAVGYLRALRPSGHATWVAILIGVQGAGLFAAGLFRLDPADGFPPGTPAGTPASATWHSDLHNLFGSTAFLALIAACFILARWFTRTGRRRWARLGRVVALVFIAGLGWALAGGQAGSLTLFVGIAVAWGWTATSALRLARGR